MLNLLRSSGGSWSLGSRSGSVGKLLRCLLLLSLIATRQSVEALLLLLLRSKVGALLDVLGLLLWPRRTVLGRVGDIRRNGSRDLDRSLGDWRGLDQLLAARWLRLLGTEIVGGVLRRLLLLVLLILGLLLGDTLGSGTGTLGLWLGVDASHLEEEGIKNGLLKVQLTITDQLLLT